MTDPSIKTQRLTLRAMSMDDVDTMHLLFTDPRVMASFDGQLFDRPMTERWVRRNLEHQEQHGYGLFAVILRKDGELIGDCGLEHMVIEGTPDVELGYDLRSPYWGRGLATEAAAAVRDFAFKQLEIPRLISLIRPANVASRRVAEKIGMTMERNILRGSQPYHVYAVRPGVVRRELRRDEIDVV